MSRLSSISYRYLEPLRQLTNKYNNKDNSNNSNNNNNHNNNNNNNNNNNHNNNNNNNNSDNEEHENKQKENLLLQHDLNSLREIFLEYFKELAIDMSFQDVDAELSQLPGKYAVDEGGFLIIAEDTESDASHPVIAACIALRKIEDGVGEIKRLFVRPKYRGLGLGSTLIRRLMSTAKQIGYRILKLDTLQRLKSANVLYEKLNFVATQPYIYNPMPDALYFEYDLANYNN